jgi:uncharacterized protein (DUF1330 family)
MAAYIVARMHIQHRDWWDKHFAQVPALIAKQSGKSLLRGGTPETLEGHGRLPDAVFVVEFPSKAHALAFWQSADLAPLIALRQTGSTLEAMLLDGA